MEDYEKKYKEALERARAWYNKGNALLYADRCMCEVFPELAGSEDEKVRKEILGLIQYTKGRRIGYEPRIHQDKMIAWLDKQGESSNNIHYWTEEEIESIISDYLRGAEHYGGMIGRLRCLKPKFLEKQGEQKPDKCDGCNNVKGCVTCVDGDQWAHYKEVEQKPIKMWHDVSEVPDEMQELLVEWESPDATWHNIAFYDAETKAFRHLKQPINNVTRWAYVSDILTQSVTKTSDKVWSEEDDEIFGRIHYACVMFYDDEDTTLVNWLNAIKRKLKGE